MYLNVIEESSWSCNKNVYTFSYSEKNNNINKITKMSLIKNLWQGYTFTRLHATGKMRGASLTSFNSCPIIFMQGLLHCK